MGKVKIIGHSLFCMCFYAHGKVLQAVPGRGSHPGLFSMGLAIMYWKNSAFCRAFWLSGLSATTPPTHTRTSTRNHVRRNIRDSKDADYQRVNGAKHATTVRFCITVRFCVLHSLSRAMRPLTASHWPWYSRTAAPRPRVLRRTHSPCRGRPWTPRRSQGRGPPRGAGLREARS